MVNLKAMGPDHHLSIAVNGSCICISQFLHASSCTPELKKLIDNIFMKLDQGFQGRNSYGLILCNNQHLFKLQAQLRRYCHRSQEFIKLVVFETPSASVITKYKGENVNLVWEELLWSVIACWRSGWFAEGRDQWKSLLFRTLLESSCFLQDAQKKLCSWNMSRRDVECSWGLLHFASTGKLECSPKEPQAWSIAGKGYEEECKLLNQCWKNRGSHDAPPRGRLSLKLQHPHAKILNCLGLPTQRWKRYLIQMCWQLQQWLCQIPCQLWRRMRQYRMKWRKCCWMSW